MDFTDKLDILYARRSSEDGKDGESIENQVALLKQYVADKGYYNIKETLIKSSHYVANMV